MQLTPPLMADSEEELQRLLMKVKEESEKAGLKLNIQKMKIMASGPITSQKIDGETMTDFILGGSKITAEELMLLSCGVGEDSWESFGLQGDPTSPP